MNQVNVLRGLTAAIAAIAAISAFAAPQHVDMRSLPYSTEPSTTIPVASSDSALAAKRTLTKADMRKLGGVKASGESQKAVGDNDVVGWFRPLTPCRLLDTRNLGAPIGGPAFSPNTVRPISPQNPLPANKCGIPSGNVTALQVVFSTQNYTVNSGGYITFKAPGAPITTVNTVYNLGAQWAAASAVVPTNSAGEFDIWVATATAEVIVDVTGYYSNLDEITAGTNQFDIFGTTVSSSAAVMEIWDTGTGTTLGLHADGGGTALNIASGSIRVTGADTVNSTTNAVFVHTTTTGAGGTVCTGSNAQYSIIKHSLLDNSPNAIILVTPRFVSGTNSFHSGTAVPAMEYYVGACNATSGTTGHWYMRVPGATFASGTAYNIMIIKP